MAACRGRSEDMAGRRRARENGRLVGRDSVVEELAVYAVLVAPKQETYGRPTGRGQEIRAQQAGFGTSKERRTATARPHRTVNACCGCALASFSIAIVRNCRTSGPRA